MAIAPRIAAALAFAALGPLTFSVAARAQSAEIFDAPKPAELQAATEKRNDRGVKRERLVALNDEGGAETRAKARGAGEKARLRLRLFPDADAEFTQTDAEPAFGGGEIWNGETEDGSATLVFSNGRLKGRVLLKGRVYRIEPAAGRLHRVQELDRAGLPPQGPEKTPPGMKRETAASPKASAAEPEAAAGVTTITTLFAYTERARNGSRNGILSDINLAVAMTNKAYEASKVRIKLKLVGTIKVEGYDEKGRSYGDVLDHLTEQTGAGAPFRPVGAERNRTKADLVALLREDGEYCGLAWAITNPSRSTADYGYSEITRECLAFDTTAHELGHNMGLYHDRYVEDPASSKLYNFGYVNLTKRVYDIMSYDNRCADAGVSCRSVAKFSNPDLDVKKQPFGIPKGVKNAADAARRLNETRTGIAAYR